MSGSNDWKIDFKRTEVVPADILSAAETIPTNNVWGCDWFGERWIDPSVYLDWAKRSLESGEDDYALSNALSHAKRSACRIIDGLVLGNHLRRYIGKNYPQKIEALRQIGVSVLSVVHDLIIDPRNQLEHDYAKPEPVEAKKAVQLAELFFGAMRQELQRQPTVALAWNIQLTHSLTAQQGGVEEMVRVHGFTSEPMLFIDVFADPALVKIVHPRDQEICQACLKDFTDEECVKLAKRLREHYVRPGGSTGTSVFFYEEVKRQAGI